MRWCSPWVSRGWGTTDQVPPFWRKPFEVRVGSKAVPELTLCPQENKHRLFSACENIQWVQFGKKSIVVMHSHTPVGVSK